MQIPISEPLISAAHERIRSYVHRTALQTCQSINDTIGCEIIFKTENLQKVGAFKMRGAMNAALSLSADDLKKGLATHSSGNHAQALSLAARTLGVPAYIVMPRTSPRQKVEAVTGYGGQITFCEPNLAARESTLESIIEETGATFIHPFDNWDVITGQATAAKELIEDAGHLDAIVAPVGGGGLLSGTALSGKFYAPETEVYGAEPEGAADAVLSFASGQIEPAPYIQTIADGLLTTLSSKTLEVIRAEVRQILLVSDSDIVEAMRLLLERSKLVVEPSGAASLAAVWRHRELFANRRVGVIISGGNVDLTQLNDWLSSTTRG
ncbi:pyridoxal-phosphate dependent enzyme [Kamptonema cortianum]|nr:pyridoxal-phosphate dependent enzyme [Geitlerinema splendidum]MDK3158445.1 pyridoxal-phosphate dependent enzyme [Kamptonema cortianum]